MLIPPRPPGYGRHRELFPRTTGDGFDPLSPATVASDVTIGFVLELDRAARMVAQHAVDPCTAGTGRSDRPPDQGDVRRRRPRIPMKPKCAAPRSACWWIG